MTSPLVPLENEDPWLGEQLQLVCAGKHPTVKKVFIDTDEVYLIPKPIKIEKLGRNDPCYCGSNKKFKHCHGR